MGLCCYSSPRYFIGLFPPIGAVLDELQVGDPRQVGRYTLLARLGSGGMGQVYFGRSLGGRHVAVKVIRADLAQDQSFRARFAREVEAARRVSGAFTAPVIDADPDAPVPWLVTDYVHGPSLGDAVAKHGPLPLPALLTLAARLAEGLGAVHAAGVIHRDLKPANVLLAEDGPRLIDFGISQAADFAQITSPTSVLGTPGFIAPELVQGEPVGPSSDIFTWGPCSRTRRQVSCRSGSARPMRAPSACCTSPRTSTRFPAS